MTRLQLNRRFLLLALAMMFFLPAASMAQQWFQSNGISGSVVDVVEKESTGAVVAAANGTNAGLYRSLTGGQLFAKVSSLMPYKLAYGAGVVFAATTTGLYKSTNLTSWTAIGGGLPSGQAVSYVGVIALNTSLMYATVVTGTAPGLYRSTNSGANWTLVLPSAGTQAVAQGVGCGVAEGNTVFAGGFINTGGPACTLSVSTDGGSTWSCTTFPNVVNDVQINCYSGTNFKDVYVTASGPSAIYRSTDFGSTFQLDQTGISGCCAANISLGGTEVGMKGSAIWTRGLGPVGTTWTQFDTFGLTSQYINHWVRRVGTTTSYVAATPQGVFYYGISPPPCDPSPCP